MKPHDRTRSWLLLTALVGLAAGYGYFFYLPGQREIALMQQQIGDARTRATSALQLVKATAHVQAEVTEASRWSDDWLADAPSEDDLSEVFGRIHELTRQTGAETTRFEPQETMAFETFRRTPVLMECQGNFAQVALVLTGLERMRETIWIENLELRTASQDGQSTSAQLTLAIFADNLEDSDQENLAGQPIIQEADQSSDVL